MKTNKTKELLLTTATKLFMDQGYDATGIRDIATSAEGFAEGWYTLDGRRLNGKPAQKGVYIKDGVKIRL